MAVVDWINMFALAVNEENAAGGRVVTAPTNGACGIVPAVLAYYDKFIRKVNSNSTARYMLVASAIGSLYKMNASISGAEVGCRVKWASPARWRRPVWLNCWAAARAVCIAAEIAMEHNLGLTCDPVAGRAGAVHRTQRYRRRESGQRRANGAAPDQRAARLPR